MRAFALTPIIITILILFFIDLYSFKGLKVLTNELNNPLIRKGVHYLHWTLFLVISTWFFIAFTNVEGMSNHKNYKYYYFLFGMVILIYLPKLFFNTFQFVDDFQFIARKVFVPKTIETDGLEPISRAKFLYQVGGVVAVLPFLGAAYGMVKGRFDFRVLEENLRFSNLPKAFNGFKVVQISDAHLGSFFDKQKPVEKALEIINSLEADVIVFTGDLVNNFSEEAENWIPLFKGMKAKMGKYSILGNHDYGDYSRWSSIQDKQKNFNRLIEIHREMGFNLLLNNHVLLEKNNEKIALIGVENWGIAPFPQKGDVRKACLGCEDAPFKILLSHDPSHWDEVVLPYHPDIDITLSGHTHGAQFGVELGNIKWSPVKYKYKRWGGLYTEAKQHLYVNRGFGYVGFPGRVGMPPEITLLKLHSTEA